MYLCGCVESPLWRSGSFLHTDTLVVMRELRSTWAQQLWRTGLFHWRVPDNPAACWILVPWPGIKPTSPALQGGFWTLDPQGSRFLIFLIPLPFLLPLLSRLIIIQISSVFWNSYCISEIKFTFAILHCKVRFWRRRKELTFIKHFSARHYARCFEDIIT